MGICVLHACSFNPTCYGCSENQFYIFLALLFLGFLAPLFVCGYGICMWVQAPVTFLIHFVKTSRSVHDASAMCWISQTIQNFVQDSFVCSFCVHARHISITATGAQIGDAALQVHVQSDS